MAIALAIARKSSVVQTMEEHRPISAHKMEVPQAIKMCG